MTSTLAAQLAAGGHAVGACNYCGRAFARDLDHQGKRHAPQRKYCSTDCRDVAAGRRRSLVTNVRRAHHRDHGDLIHRHELEAAGQQSVLDEPLPAVPVLVGA